MAAATVYRRGPVAAAENVALYTVSGWDGDMPDPPFAPDGTAADDVRLSRHILEESNPVTWLRMLSNNALCQVSISEGFRGPNAHLVGDSDAIGQAIAVAAADLEAGAAEQALIVAYDTHRDHRHHPSGRAVTSAAALSLAESTDDGDVLPALLALADSLAETGGSGTELLARCVAELAPSGAVGSRSR